MENWIILNSALTLKSFYQFVCVASEYQLASTFFLACKGSFNLLIFRKSVDWSGILQCEWKNILRTRLQGLYILFGSVVFQNNLMALKEMLFSFVSDA